MICISRRRRRSCCEDRESRSMPSNRIVPVSGSIRRRTARPAVVLPQPDSPTRPNVSPLLISKLMSSTAFTWAATRARTPRRIGKYFLRFRTLKRGSRASGMNATDLLAFRNRFERNWRERALDGLFVATRRERAAVRQMKETGDHSFDHVQPILLLDAGSKTRYRLEQAL